jgi:hypothetical protein
MLGLMSKFELLTVGPRLVGVPKVKSAFETSAARANVKTNTIEIFFFILLPFQKLLIFSCRHRVFLSKTRAGAALFTAILLLKNRLFGFADPTLINGKKGANEGFCCNFLQKLVKFVNIFDFWRSARIHVYFQSQDPAFSRSGQGW